MVSMDVRSGIHHRDFRSIARKDQLIQFEEELTQIEEMAVQVSQELVNMRTR